MKTLSLLSIALSILTFGCSEQNKLTLLSDSEYGYSITIPTSWSYETTEVEGFEIIATSPGELTSIKLQSRYIKGTPPNVASHREWVELQYSDIPNGYYVNRIEEKNFTNASCMEIYFHHESSELKISAHSLNIMNYISRPESNRMWVLSTTTADTDFLSSKEYKDIVDSLRLEKFEWKL
ncbi:MULTISPECIES: hypothetical protein [unclassified Lentimonas]|uniref:hypothetical protein n=1 Tax=unclassified Lentimonas TaxID=2630993 RepID=UPI0013272D5F|nr:MULTISPECIES: hypothetical protein [unclassified Lentimonas]CAA6691761.1 Unannotated [Lentimonas sp. CC19]CAA6696333.1 Unannotated [Lentimonas sp. CC10]CAA7071283.1 Unannotated [Lentimonas sp. CC11]